MASKGNKFHFLTRTMRRTRSLPLSRDLSSNYLRWLNAHRSFQNSLIMVLREYKIPSHSEKVAHRLIIHLPMYIIIIIKYCDLNFW